MSYLETVIVDNIYDDNAMGKFFGNPAAINFIIQQNFTGKQMVEYGAQYEHFYPYFDIEYCCELYQKRSSTFSRFIKNPASVRFIEEHFDEIFQYFRSCLSTIARQKHHINIITANADKFTLNMVDVSANPAAIKLFEENPQLISWPDFVILPGAIDMIIAFLKNKIECNKYMDSAILNKFNLNPAALPFLIDNPGMITDFIIMNPAIFEEDI